VDGAGSGVTLRHFEDRLTQALSVGPALSELAFHACWLRHAVAEKRAASPTAPRPFLEILRLAERSAAQSVRS
jgi:hypothetical protein